MKKIILSIALSVALLFGNISFVSAESVAVQGNLALIADKGLFAREVLSGQPSQCFVDGAFDPNGNDISNLLVTATDVVIDANIAVVTIHPVDTEGNTITDIVTVDITSCLEITDVVVDVKECISTVDIAQGILIIPCVEIGGDVVTVEMERRGNSDNWEVSFLGANPNFGGDDGFDDDN